MGRNKGGEPTLAHHTCHLSSLPPHTHTLDFSSMRARSMFPVVSSAPGVDLTWQVFSRRLAKE